MSQSRVREYLESLVRYNSDICEIIRERALEDEVPIIRRDTESFLKTVLAMKRPKTILEVGTAVGYSAIVMAESCKAQITTIEKYEKRIPIAKSNFLAAGKEKQIHFLTGDAAEVLADLVNKKEKYDFIFMDAAKAQYFIWLPMIRQLLSDGGILFSDNVLQDGTVAESRFGISRRPRSIHTRMRDYLYALTHDEHWTTSILEVGDGVSLSVWHDEVWR
jgi:O-methyltransferase